MPKKQDPKRVSHKDFEKLELRVGKIKAVKLHQNKRDYIMAVDLGPVEQDLQVVADLKEISSIVRCSQGTTVFPKPDTDVLLL